MNWIGLVLAVRARRVPVRGAAVSGEIRMNALGIFQIVLYMVVLVALAKPLGAFMAKVYQGERTFLSPVLGPLERGIYRLGGVDPNAEVELEALCGRRAAVQPDRLPGRVSAAAPARRAAAQPAGLCRGQPGLLVQHRRQLRHEHELAGLRRRVDDELSHADARARGAELPVRRIRHGGAGRADPRLRAPAGERRSATSGSTSRAARSTSCCRCRCSSRSSWCRRASCRTSRRISRRSARAGDDTDAGQG